MKLFAKALVGAAALAALSAQAGPYVGGSLGATRYKGPDIGGATTDRSSNGGKLYGGYEFNDNIAVEAGYADVGKAKSAAGDVKGHGVYVDAVGKLPLSQSFSVLGRVGAFNGHSKSSTGGSDSGTDLKYGAGLQWDMNKQASIRGEWERYRFKTVGTKADADMLSVGLNYRF